MRYLAIILFASLITSCGKPPLFNKITESVNEVVGGVLISESFPLKKIEFTLTWKVPPSLDELGVFDLDLKEPLAVNQTIDAFIWMPDMGHGSSPIEIVKNSDLNYSFSEIAFIMPGLWVLHIEIKENNQVVDKWQKSIVL